MQVNERGISDKVTEMVPADPYHNLRICGERKNEVRSFLISLSSRMAQINQKTLLLIVKKNSEKDFFQQDKEVGIRH